MGKETFKTIVPGVPRDKNVMQIALYQWWFGNPHGFEYARLIYGDRGEGRIAEYLIDVREDEPGIWDIYYQQIVPRIGVWTKASFSINDILDSIVYIKSHIANRTVPPRDFDWYIPKEKLDLMYSRNQLGKTDREQYEKHRDRVLENEQLIAAGSKPKADIKPLVKEDWHCGRCDWRDVCYTEEGVPKIVTC